MVERILNSRNNFFCFVGHCRGGWKFALVRLTAINIEGEPLSYRCRILKCTDVIIDYRLAVLFSCSVSQRIILRTRRKKWTERPRKTWLIQLEPVFFLLFHSKMRTYRLPIDMAWPVSVSHAAKRFAKLGTY